MTVTDAFIRALPKAEVHVHLEGCFEIEELRRLAAENGEHLPRPPEQMFSFDGLTDFLEFLDWSAGLVRTPDQAARTARRFADRQKRSGVSYTDVILNPTHWAAWRDDLDGLMDALDWGWTEAEQDGAPPTGLCLSLLRQQSAAEAAELVDWMIGRRHPRVVGLSIDGNEAMSGRVSARFADAFSRANEAGIPTTVHAGESSGPEGVWDAIDVLGATRIDHGVRAVEDPALVSELAQRQIPLGICPGSNVALGYYPDRESHPVESLRRSGVRVSLNTDDGTSLDSVLEDEYTLTAATFGWDETVVSDVARCSIEAAFCTEDERARLLAELDTFLAQLSEES